MKKGFFYTGLVFVLIGSLFISRPWCSVKESPSQEKAPKTVFYFGIEQKPVYSKSVVDSPKNRYVFTPVLQFDQVKHDFIVRNTTKTMLEFKKVEGCCGSLVEAFTAQIPPGKEGVIRAILFTDRRGGEEIKGTIRAQTNDPKNPEWMIDISCYVKKFADISEYTIMLDGSWRGVIEGSSVVIPAKEYPFKITGVKAKKGQDIVYGYSQIKKDGKKAYLITAKNKRVEAGAIRDTIYVQTDNPARPEFIIRVQGKVTD